MGRKRQCPRPAGCKNPSANVSRSQINTEASEDPDGAVFGHNPDDDDFGVFVPNMRAPHSHLWFRGEALLWWLKGGQTPALLATSPAGTPLSQAGVLGQPGTTVLVGDEGMNPGMHAGGRISFGTWFGNAEESGLEVSYMILGQNQQSFGTPSNGILARPFFDTQSNAETSQVIAFPNVWDALLVQRHLHGELPGGGGPLAAGDRQRRRRPHRHARGLSLRTAQRRPAHQRYDHQLRQRERFRRARSSNTPIASTRKTISMAPNSASTRNGAADGGSSIRS